MTQHKRRISARDGLGLSAHEWGAPGPRTPILCLPGICRTALDFAALAARHAGERRVVALDYAGHGDSDRAADPSRYTPEVALRDVLDAMAALHLHRVALVGTSFGGLMAMGVAILRPSALAAVVLNDIGPRLEPTGRDLLVELLGRDHAFASLGEAAGFLAARLPDLGFAGSTEAGWRDYAARTYAKGPDGRWHPRWDTRIVDPARWDTQPLDMTNAFGALAHVPLLLVHGEASDLLTAATVARMRAMRPDMALVSLPGVGHAPTLEDPASIAALDAFLAAIA